MIAMILDPAELDWLEHRELRLLLRLLADHTNPDAWAALDHLAPALARHRRLLSPRP